MLSAVAGALIVLSIGILVAHAWTYSARVDGLRAGYRTLTKAPHAAAKPAATSRESGLSQSAGLYWQSSAPELANLSNPAEENTPAAMAKAPAT
jgi:hypothetical protein